MVFFISFNLVTKFFSRRFQHRQNINFSLNSLLQLPEDSSRNSLKSGPQVLIRNVNGSVVITPIPSTDAEVPAKKAASKMKSKIEAAAGKGEGRRTRPVTKNGKTSLGENIDEISKLSCSLESLVHSKSIFLKVGSPKESSFMTI